MPENADDPQRAKRPSLKEFDAYADRNGQDFGQDDAGDVGRPAELQHERESDPAGQAEVVRIASGHPHLDSVSGGSTASVEATEAETPPENLRHIGDASTARKAP